MNKSMNQEREAFEAWRLEKFCGGQERLKKCSNAPDVYYYAAERESWKAWQEAVKFATTRPAQPEQEPFWYAVVSEQAPSINSAIRRLDVAQEFADSKRERWPDTRVVPLYAAPIAQAAPQPEQSGLVAALEQFADDSNWCYDTCNISRDVAKDALASYRSTQGGDA